MPTFYYRGDSDGYLVELFEENLAWAQKFYAALKTDPTNFLPATYPPLTSTEDLNLKLNYGS
jgi:hypothetical protein